MGLRSRSESEFLGGFEIVDSLYVAQQIREGNGSLQIGKERTRGTQIKGGSPPRDHDKCCRRSGCPPALCASAFSQQRRLRSRRAPGRRKDLPLCLSRELVEAQRASGLQLSALRAGSRPTLLFRQPATPGCVTDPARGLVDACIQSCESPGLLRHRPSGPSSSLRPRRDPNESKAKANSVTDEYHAS
ncbi:hypothetical protein TGPRC2_297495 [Toxoplasma gondii TgCatPRC2]|uniref:Uncharacterized protein n=1 Tax=Toxoplasma gondii TgCatPRC2 TaxID=1130821 RepID=A0A151H200_TOXGO|nr:hypothetical protein TGPRC2_297495 [Toxoplasma gondii TgCatPRC2]